jgi:hypothetical protein
MRFLLCMLLAALLLAPASATAAPSAPAPVSDLRIARSDDTVVLSWTHSDASIQRYEVWRAVNQPYGMPGAAGTFLADSVFPGALGALASYTDIGAGFDDPDIDGYYTVVGMTATGQTSGPSNRVGVAEYLLTGAASTCAIFPADNVWNTRIDTLPIAANSQAYVNTIGAAKGIHTDFGAGLWDGGPIGIPYTTTVGAPVVMTFDYADESDPGPYPIPPNPPIEGGPNSDGDRHILILDQTACKLYELYYTWPQTDGSWQAGSGAIFNLRSNALRPDTWTSADAAGLPILAGLVRYDEVAAGAINHALRFTAPQTRKTYVWPARHYASSLTGTQYPPMGQRFRLRPSFDISGFSATNQIILAALKNYGMILADNGSSWYLSGAPDERWNNDDLRQLQTRVHGSDFEAVDTSSLMVDPGSGQARLPSQPSLKPQAYLPIYSAR